MKCKVCGKIGEWVGLGEIVTAVVSTAQRFQAKEIFMSEILNFRLKSNPHHEKSDAHSEIKALKKQHLLKLYKQCMNPVAFTEYDGQLALVDKLADSMTIPDSDGDYMERQNGWELDYGLSRVRVLIARGTQEQDAIRLLEKIIAWIKADGLRIEDGWTEPTLVTCHSSGEAGKPDPAGKND